MCGEKNSDQNQKLQFHSFGKSLGENLAKQK